MELHFIEGKEKSMTELVGVFGWKIKGQADMDTESDERLWKGTLRKKFYSWLGLTKFRLKLIK